MGVGLTGAFKKSKLSEAVAQPSARDAVLHHFVPELTRYTLAGLYQRYDAAKVEKVIQEGALKLAFRFSKKSINNAELRTQIDVFIQNELKQSIEDGVRESFTKMNQDFLNDGMKDVYLAGFIFFKKIIEDIFLVFFFKIQRMQWNAQKSGYPQRILPILEPRTFIILQTFS
jgi:hypothetical protein